MNQSRLSLPGCRTRRLKTDTLGMWLKPAEGASQCLAREETMSTGDRILHLLPAELGLDNKSTFSDPVRIVHSVAEETSPATPNVLHRVMLSSER